MYELIINGRTVYTTTNKADATLANLFDFYRTNKAVMNIYEVVIINGAEEFFVEGWNLQQKIKKVLTNRIKYAIM